MRGYKFNKMFQNLCRVFSEIKHVDLLFLGPELQVLCLNVMHQAG